MRGLLVVLLLVVSVILMGSDLKGCETETVQHKKQFSYSMNDAVRVFITMEHKPNGSMIKDRKINITYYIVDCYLDKSRVETLTEEDLNALLKRGLQVDFYDKTGNRLLRLNPYRYSYDENAKLVKDNFSGGIVAIDMWRLTWKGVLTEERLTFEAFRDIDSVEVKDVR